MNEIEINLKFKIGASVYLKIDKEQLQRMITGYCIRQSGITYELMQGGFSSWHYDFELATEECVLTKIKFS